MRLIWDAEGKKYATNDATPELIEELIDELNNDTHTMVALDARGRASMIVSGGLDNRVRVNFVPEDLEKPTKHLLDHDMDGDMIKLKMNGKFSTYRMIHTVTKAVAITALLAFLKNSAPAEDLDWLDDA